MSTVEREGVPGITMRRLLGMGMTGRLIVDTSARLFDPFLPLIAAGLGTSIVTVGGLVSLRSLMGVLSPIAGNLAQQRGYRTVMRSALLMLSAGMILFGLGQSIWVAAIALMMIGVGIFSFTPILQAYLSEQLPYHRRARGIGIVEYGWALAGIIGLPLAGLAIERFGWRAPFLILGGMLLLIWLLFGLLPVVVREKQAPRSLATELVASYRLKDATPSVLAALAALALHFFGAIHLMVAHGAWLNDEYSLGAAALGTVALGIGVVELCGSVLVSLVTDRLGKRRSILWSMVLTFVTYLMIPLANFALLPVVTVLLISRFGFEVAVVAAIPLLSEQLPTQRSQVLTLSAAAVTLVAAVAGLTGTIAYTRLGLSGLTVPAAAATFAAWFLVWRWVDEQGAGVPPELSTR